MAKFYVIGWLFSLFIAFLVMVFMVKRPERHFYSTNKPKKDGKENEKKTE